MEERLEDSHHHIYHAFNAELENVHTQLMKMGGLVQQQLQDALSALAENNTTLAEKVVVADHKVNALEVEIDEACTRILARRQPTAGDLRLVMAVIKTITDLERIGDEAERIARMAMKNAAQHQKSQLSVDVQHLGRQVAGMLQQGLDAFARMDADAALAIAHEDERVDREYDSIIRQLITYMMEDPRSIPLVLNIMWAARALERIGDRARNICEYVIYFVKGKNVRHINLETLEQMLQED